jgi:hypothetical protein
VREESGLDARHGCWVAGQQRTWAAVDTPVRIQCLCWLLQQQHLAAFNKWNKRKEFFRENPPLEWLLRLP